MSGLRILRAVGGQVIGEPVRSGRLRRTGWPPGLTMIMIMVGAACLVALGLMFGSGPLRSGLDLIGTDAGSTLPEPVLPVIYVALLVVTAAMLTGALHAPWPIAVAAIGYGAVQAMIMASSATGGLTDPEALFAGLGWLALVAFQLVRKLRGSFHGWEYGVVLALLIVIVVVPAVINFRTSAPSGVDDRAIQFLIVLFAFAAASLPMVVLAGAALSEVALSTSVWTAESLGRELAGTGLRLVTAILAIVALGCSAYDLITARQSAGELLSGFLASILIMVVAAAVWWLAGRAGRDDDTVAGSRSLTERRGVLIAIAAALALPKALQVLLIPVAIFFAGPVAATVPGFPPVHWVPAVDAFVTERAGVLETFGGFLLTSLVAIGVAVRARAGEPSTDHSGPFRLAAVVTVLTLFSLGRAVGWWTPNWSEQAIGGLLTVAVIIVGAVWTATRRLTRPRLVAIALVLMIAIAVGRRELIGDPLAALIGLAGGSALIFGIAWNLLTGAEDANGDSPRFPRPARALLVIGNAAFGILALAFNALSRSEQGLNLGLYGDLGSRMIGTALLLAAGYGVMLAALAGRGTAKGATVAPGSGPPESVP